MTHIKHLYVCQCVMSGHNYVTDSQEDAIAFLDNYGGKGWEGHVTKQVITTDITENWLPKTIEDYR